MSGKWHLSGGSMDSRAFHPLARGFHQFFGTIMGAGSFFHPHTLQSGFETVDPGDGFYYTDAITDHAVKSLRQSGNTNRPFFHYVAYTAPHWPMHIPADDLNLARYRKIYADGWDRLRARRYEKMKRLGIVDPSVTLCPRDPNVPAWADIADHREWQIERMSVYAAMLERVDSGVGKIVQSLKDSGDFDNTLILFLSDNGGSPEDIGFQNGLNTLGRNPFTGDGKRIQIGRDPMVLPGPEASYQGVGREWANLNNVPFRHFKTSSHHGGIATPFILSWPGGVKEPGRIVRQVSHVIDVVPTILDIAGISYPESRGGDSVLPPDGISLKRFITQSDASVISRTLYFSFGGKAAIRDGDWKLVTTSRKLNKWELYFIPNDPVEMDNKADEFPETTAHIRQKYRKWASKVGIILPD